MNNGFDSDLMSTENLPENWDTIRLGDYCHIRGGYGFPHRYQGHLKGIYPFYKVSDMNLPSNSLFMTNSNNYIDDEIKSALRAVLFPADTIIFPKIGQTIYTNKKRMLTRYSLIDNNVMGVTVKDTNKCIPLFLLMHFLAINLSDLANTGTLPSITGEKVKELIISLPPISEQTRITIILSAVQESKEKTDNIITATRELKKSLMKHLFTYGAISVEEAEKVPLQETDFGSVPLHWEIMPLDRCSTVQTGVAKGRRLTGTDIINVPYLRVANVQDGYLNLNEMKYIDIRRSELDRFLLHKGDIVLTEGGDFDKLGRGFIWQGEIPSCVHQNHIFAVRANSKIISPEFLSYMVQSGYAKAYFLSVAHKTTNLACINTTKLKALPVLIPPRAEQERITSMLDRVDDRIRMEENNKKVIEELFKTLLHNLMTGKVRVNDLEV